jgi:riboflavin biosynthesis pyrimidine reductase
LNESIRIELLFERPGLPRFALPAGLAEAYGGDLGLASPRLFANFVASVDGVVALRDRGESGHVVALDSEADRFVMGLLRACADVVLIGAGTFRKTPGARWHAEAIHPPSASLFAELRRLRGLRPVPPLAVVTGSGEIDPAGPALDDALIFTTPAGESKLRGRVPVGAVIHVLAPGFRTAEVIEHLHRERMSAVLTEGGPSLVGQLIGERLLDELFVTRSPKVFGRLAADGRKSLVDGTDVERSPALELASVRRHGSYLFLRYFLDRS